MISHELYYALNLAPLFSGLPALTLTAKRWAQDASGHTASGRTEVQETSRAVARLTGRLWAALTVWCVVLNVQTVSQLVLAPVEPHLGNNLWRAVGWTAAGAVTLCVALYDIWRRPGIVRAIRTSAIREVEPTVRRTV